MKRIITVILSVCFLLTLAISIFASTNYIDSQDFCDHAFLPEYAAMGGIYTGAAFISETNRLDYFGDPIYSAHGECDTYHSYKQVAAEIYCPHYNRWFAGTQQGLGNVATASTTPHDVWDAEADNYMAYFACEHMVYNSR